MVATNITTYIRTRKKIERKKRKKKEKGKLQEDNNRKSTAIRIYLHKRRRYQDCTLGKL